MTRFRWPLRAVSAVLAAIVLAVVPGCGWRGVNTLPLPGTEGGGPDAYTIQAQLPDVATLERNSRVRVGDVTVGNVTKIERQGWHALLTMTVNGNVHLPANATATVGQTSLLGSLHVELAPPVGVPPKGRLTNGSLIPLSAGRMYPSTEHTLASISMLLNGGGIGEIHEITETFATAFAGREDDLRSLINEFDTFVTYINDQTGDIIAATESLNNLAGQFAAQDPVVDRALRTIPDALAVVKEQRANLAEALDKIGKLSALAADSVNKTKESFVAELKDFGPVFESLANSGRSLTRSLSMLATYPWPNETMQNWVRGDYGNMTGVFDLTLSRIDSSMFTGTRWEGDLTELEMQWGRTIGVLPSPYTAGNPLTAPYHMTEGS